MINYYTVQLSKPENITREQQETLDKFVEKYHAKMIPAKFTIILDFNHPTKIIPRMIREELKGLEIKFLG